MTRTAYKKKRMLILQEIEETKIGCKGCKIHKKLNKEKKITELTNTCKSCEIGKKLSVLGTQLLKLTADKNNR